MDTSLTAHLLQETHTAGEYLGWTKGLARNVLSEANGKEQLRLRRGLAKELMNEAIPIGIFASRYFDNSVHVDIRLVIGNQNYDALVNDKRENPSSVSHIEVTLAHEGENEYLRMLCLHEKGEASGIGSVTKSGTKKTGLKVDVAPEMVSQAEILRRERNLVSEAIARKQSKSYPLGTLLLIAFDDTMAFDRRDNIANLESVLTECMPALSAFHTVAIVGLQQGLFICRQTSRITEGQK